MPLRFLQRWPKTAGFEIHGKGPCYVISVEKGSLAHRSGLVPGDQILEVDGRDVTNLGAEKIRALAKKGSNQPPELEVVSCLQTLVINSDHPLGYGFSILNEKPLKVGSVDYGGPAYKAGLRAGDIILEVNSRTPVNVHSIGTILSQCPGKLTVLTIPVGRTSNMVQVDKTLSRATAPDTRLYKARDLHNKLEGLLGEDYKSKMAVVSALKRYAEDRDITILCKALNGVLKSKQQRQILKQIRLLIPPSQRPHFDDMMNSGRLDAVSTTSGPSHAISSSSGATAHHMGLKKLIQIVREEDSFGFVIKSSSPAYIESIDPGGAAEKGGLMPGDYLIKLNGIDVRKCDHDRLVQLLQDSGSAPTLEILRCTKYGSIRSVSSSSSSSSHNSVDNILYSDVITDKGGKTFTDKISFLLTHRERNQLKKALRSYDMTRDIIQLYDSAMETLDTPSKKTLWSFIFVLLSVPHREYVSHRVNLSQELLMEIVKSDYGRNAHDIDGQEQDPADSDLKDFPTSFQHQLDFLLTSTERFQFKKSLKAYERNQELSSLAKTLESVLDTPSKRILWRLVLPRLTNGHREVMKGRLELHGRQTASAPLNLTAMESYIGQPDDANDELEATSAPNTDTDILYGTGKLQGLRDDLSSSTDNEDESTDDSDSILSSHKSTKPSYLPEDTGYNPIIMQELEATKKAVQEVRDALLAKEKDGTNVEIEDDLDLDQDFEYLDARRYVTIIPVGYPGLEQKSRSFYNRKMDSQQYNSLKKEKNLPDHHGTQRRMTLPSAGFLLDSRISRSIDNDSDTEKHEGNELSASKDISAMTALLELDAAMADETSDLEISPRTMKLYTGVRNESKDSEAFDGDEDGEGEADNEKETAYIPPPPPPPPLPMATGGTDVNHTRMSVKRINWEKLDNRNVENTIWEKFHEHDLSEVIQYLELETQFSTKPYHQRDGDKKKEVLIMDRKKAYNISILLGHLKMSVTEVKQALYSMDESTLSPELLGQLLAFVPNEHEITQYKLYKGDKSLLTKPDQFAYQMSLVGNYEKRLKALLFKASFKEKTEELRENLENIKGASLELRNSKKLARLLEVILAMGNFMNKGNSRVGEAAGFRINFLTQLDVTKTADKKSTFLNVLADAAYNKFPEVLSLGDELATVEKAGKVSIETLTEDIQDLKKALHDTSGVLNHISDHSHNTNPGDRFQDVMGHFIAEATDEIQSIFRLQASAMTEFGKTVTFLGEDPKTMSTNDVFEIFSEFIKNFERAHRHNLMLKRQ